MRLSLCLGGGGGAEYSFIVLVSEALPLLGGEERGRMSMYCRGSVCLGGGGGAECSCIVLVSEALPLLGGGGGRNFMYCTCQ